MLLFANVAGFLVVVVGVLVTAANLQDPKWKKRAIIAALVLGAVSVVASIIVFEQTPGNPRFFSELLRSLGELIASIVANRLIQFALFLTLGLISGWYLRKLIRERRPRSLLKAATALQWPRVNNWLSPLEAIDSFVDKKILDEVSNREAQCKAMAIEMQRAEAAYRAAHPSELGAILEMGKGKPSKELEAKRCAAQKFNEARDQLQIARNNVLEDLISQLKSGRLVARAVPFDPKLLHPRWEILNAAYWVSLTFDSHDPKLETISGGERKFKGLQIGKEESFR